MAFKDDQPDTRDSTGRIRLMAYRLWEQADKPEGRDLDFWGRAEEILSSEAGLDESPRTPTDMVVA